MFCPYCYRPMQLKDRWHLDGSVNEVWCCHVCEFVHEHVEEAG